jgi:enoyl-[acyl-carrier protein] reductase I
MRRLVDIAEIGGGASGMTGDTIYVDGGLHNLA